MSASSYSLGQVNGDAQLLINQEVRMQEQIKKHSASISKKREHILYLDQSWQHSALVTKNGDIAYFNGRYSVLDNHIELINESGMRAIRPDRVSAAMVGNKYFLSVPKDQIKGNANTSFFEVLSVGKINLYLKHILKSRMKGSNSLTTGYNGEKQYYIDEELYYQNEGQLCQKLKSKKKILALFSSKKEDVDSFAKSNDLKYKSIEDLKRIFDHYNELTKKESDD